MCTFEEDIQLLASGLAHGARSPQHSLCESRFRSRCTSSCFGPERLKKRVATCQLLGDINIAGAVQERTQHRCEPRHLVHWLDRQFGLAQNKGKATMSPKFELRLQRSRLSRHTKRTAHSL